MLTCQEKVVVGGSWHCLLFEARNSSHLKYLWEHRQLFSFEYPHFSVAFWAVAQAFTASKNSLPNLFFLKQGPFEKKLRMLELTRVFNKKVNGYIVDKENFEWILIKFGKKNIFWEIYFRFRISKKNLRDIKKNIFKLSCGNLA